jgi:hypothetical protein
MFESKINRGRANGYAPLNGDGKVGLNYLPDVVGVAGTSGTSGRDGSQGSSGATGTSGTSGTSGVNGANGSQGPAGSSFTWAGAWNSEAIYGDLNTVVEYQGSSYVCVSTATNLNRIPSVETGYWNLMAKSAFSGVDTGSFATTGSNIFTGNQNIIGNINLSGSLNISSSMIISSTVVNNGTINALNSDLIIDGGDIILSGSMYFGSGSSITENSSSIIITPAGAAAGQSLVVRQTGIANLYSDHPSGFYLGDTITLTFSPNNNYLVSGSAPYIFTGCTQEQLGTSLSGSLIYNDEYTKTLTWTIPALSDISGFTFEIYNFVFFVSQSISLSSSGSSEQSHIHLVSGDPSTVDIYLGDDDQYVKIEKNGGDVVIGTNINTNHWIFDTSGSLIVPGNIIGAYNLATTGSNTFIGNNTLTGNTVLSGSVSISGSTIQYGNNTLIGANTINGTNTIIGNTILSGSINVSGSFTGSLQIDGDLNFQSPHSFYRWGNKLFNYGQWCSLETQTGSANTAYPMKLEVPVPEFEGIYVGNNGSGFPTRIYAQYTGLYNIQFSAQLHTTSNESVDFSVWFAITGSNIANSNTDFSIEKVSGGGFQVAALNFLTPITSGSYVELYWSKTTANGQLQAKGTQVSPTRPVTPSVIVTVTQVA